jgi:hypothetical protein
VKKGANPVGHVANWGNSSSKMHVETTGTGSFVNWNTWPPKGQSSEKSWYVLVVNAPATTIVPAETLKCFSECQRPEIRFQSWAMNPGEIQNS